MIKENKRNKIAYILIIFFSLTLIYNINMSCLTHGDPIPNSYQALNLVSTGSFYLDNKFIQDRNIHYALAKTTDGHFVSIFGMGTPLLATPIFFIGNIFSDLWSWNRLIMTAKFIASVFVAVSAVLLFLILISFTSYKKSFSIAMLYGLGTCVWSISSQALWQHAPSILFLGLAAYFLFKGIFGEEKYFKYVGAVLAFSIVIRPNNLVVFIVFTISYFLYFKKYLKSFILTSIPIFIILGIYNIVLFGSPFANAHLDNSAQIAMYKIGSTQLWHFPLEGFLGIIFSPSRGILFFSPFLFFTIFAFLRINKMEFKNATDKTYNLRIGFKILLFSATGLVLLASSWFDWWGGWSYGYRSVVDASLFLCIFLYPVLDWIQKRKIIKYLFVLTIAWSLLVQMTGAFTADFARWNNNPDIDTNHQRLWSISDSMILYHLQNFKLRRNITE